jgi:LPXTG-motif cell wall-anchored protein
MSKQFELAAMVLMMPLLFLIVDVDMRFVPNDPLLPWLGIAAFVALGALLSWRFREK